MWLAVDRIIGMLRPSVAHMLASTRSFRRVDAPSPVRRWGPLNGQAAAAAAREERLLERHLFFAVKSYVKYQWEASLLLQGAFVVSEDIACGEAQGRLHSFRIRRPRSRDAVRRAGRFCPATAIRTFHVRCLTSAHVRRFYVRRPTHAWTCVRTRGAPPLAPCPCNSTPASAKTPAR